MKLSRRTPKAATLRGCYGNCPMPEGGAGLRTLASCCGKDFIYSTASSDLISDKGGISLRPLGYCKIL